ncbi:MAG: cyclic pyranopterin monophosphate synthase MoaC [Methylophilaceae bacterium]|nr:cyclic pyranopterin monophosphate synthase MoaC [Methylophilaceae bacterium]
MLTHIDENGNAKMINISGKEITQRLAIASGMIAMKNETLGLVKSQSHKKGDVLTVAKIAAIQGAKNTSALIPMCHPIALTSIEIEFKVHKKDSLIECIATTQCSGQTGVEMEALAAVTIGLLTIYDMCKATDKGMIITNISLIKKSGGDSGLWEK